MAFYNSFPPHQTLRPPLPLSQTTTLTHIQSYLALSLTNPHLHPDCAFDEHGPTLGGHSSSGGLVLHQLRRVEAGLRGERLGGEVVLLENGEVRAVEDGGEGEVQLAAGDDTRLDGLILGRMAAPNGVATQGEEEEEVEVEDWQTKNVQEQMGEQAGGILEGERGEGDPAVMVGRVGSGAGEVGVWEVEETAWKNTPARKTARKRAKKERSKNEQRERELGRQGKRGEGGEEADAVAGEMEMGKEDLAKSIENGEDGHDRGEKKDGRKRRKRNKDGGEAHRASVAKDGTSLVDHNARKKVKAQR